MSGMARAEVNAAVGLGKTLWWVPFAMLAASTALVAWRRVAGGLHTPPHWPLALLASLCLWGMAGAIRWCVGRGLGWGLQGPRWLLPAAVSALVVLAGASLTLEGSPPGTVAALWIPLVMGETWAWTRRMGNRRSDERVGPDGGEVIQRLTRLRLPGGKDVIEGMLHCPLAPGQRTGSVHVAFCPPFAGIPKVTAEQISGPPARVRLGVVLPHGARVDVRLAAKPNMAPQLVVLRFAAAG